MTTAPYPVDGFLTGQESRTPAQALPAADLANELAQFYDPRYEARQYQLAVASLGAAAPVTMQPARERFPIRSIEFDNPGTGAYYVSIEDFRFIVPAGVVAFRKLLPRPTHTWSVSVLTAPTTSNTLDVTLNEAPFPSTDGISASGGTAVTATITGPLGQAAMAASIPVVIASNQSAVPVDTELPAAAALADATANPTAPLVGADLEVYNGATWDRLRSFLAAVGGAGTGVAAAGALLNDGGTIRAWITARNAGDAGDGSAIPAAGLPYQFNGATYDRQRGTGGAAYATEHAAVNVATAQQISTAVAATLLVARATRKKATIRNLDATNSVWLGPAVPVTTGNGVILKAGESRDYFGQPILQIIDNGSHATVDVIDYYD